MSSILNLLDHLQTVLLFGQRKLQMIKWVVRAKWHPSARRLRPKLPEIQMERMIRQIINANKIKIKVLLCQTRR